MFLGRDPRHRSDCAQSSARSCKENRIGAWPKLRTPPTVDRRVRTKPRIGPSLVSQVQCASFAFSRISSNPCCRHSYALLIQRQLTEDVFHISNSLPVK